LTLRAKLDSFKHHPLIIKDILKGRSREELRAKIRRLNGIRAEREAFNFISYLKKNSPWQIINPNDQSRLNRLCCIEDWENSEIKEIISELQKLCLQDFDWRLALIIGRSGFIHRKGWEWVLGIIAMRRFGKLNEKSTAIGIGSGKEVILFYLTNKVKHVYATDLYGQDDGWKASSPSDFPENPKKYAPFRTRKTP
jgi:hypothetical protein